MLLGIRYSMEKEMTKSSLTKLLMTLVSHGFNFGGILWMEYARME